MAYFSVGGLAPLSRFSPPAHVHVIGVCGVAMAQIALLLEARGYRVSGSDKEFYEPMSGLLRRSRIVLRQGYAAEHLHPVPDVVLIGNAVSYGNVEVAVTEQEEIPYTIFPALLNEMLISPTRSIVVAGTHGKTTTSALGAYVLSRLGVSPSYFVGGAMRDLGSSLAVGSGGISVVEGDEYDSAFFAKVPKFSFYGASTFVITSLEYDHADIYPDIGAIEAVFAQHLAALPPAARVVACADDERVLRLATGAAQSGRTVFLYGKSDAAQSNTSQWRLVSSTERGAAQEVEAVSPDGARISFKLKIPGTHNALNALSVIAALACEGVAGREIYDALAGFSGVKRRQEVVLEQPIVLVEDFAHHPTAVRETVQAMRARFPNRPLWAVFEPRSNTSRRALFADQYAQAFGGASQVVLSEVQRRANDAASDILDVQSLADRISAAGTPARVAAHSDAIAALLASEVPRGAVVLVMSNGSFGGLVQKLRDYFIESEPSPPFQSAE